MKTVHEPIIRIGYGYDIHRLEPIAPTGQGQPFLLGGVLVSNDLGPVAVTDGDVLMHAITDGLLGALALPSMGQMFKNDDPRKGTVLSATYLKEACWQVRSAGWEVENIDSTVILEKPRIKDFLMEVRKSLSAFLEIDVTQLNVKAKTHEGLDELGAGKAVEVHACVLLSKRATRI